MLYVAYEPTVSHEWEQNGGALFVVMQQAPRDEHLDELLQELVLEQSVRTEEA